MGDGFRTVLVVLLGIVAVTGLVGLGLVAFVYVKYRPGVKAVASMLGALAYTASPVDPLPELLLGPIGLVDDAAVVTVAYVIVRRAIAARRESVARRGIPR